MEMIGSILRPGRTQLFADNLKLTQGQAYRFWPLYREYATKRTALHQVGTRDDGRAH
jgi:hypothetical protein